MPISPGQPTPGTAALIQLAHETLNRSHVVCAESAAVLALARATIRQAKDEMHRIDMSPAGFASAGNVSVLWNGAPWRSLGS